MKSLVLMSLATLILASCNENRDLGQKTGGRPTTLISPHSINYNYKDFEDKRSMLLNKIYNDIKSINEFKSTEEIEKVLEEGVPTSSKDADFAKLVIMRPESELVFYIPEHITAKWAYDNLTFERVQGEKHVWINSKFKKGETSFLIFYSDKELLVNEKKFQIKKFTITNVELVHLTDISRYQDVKIKILKRKLVVTNDSNVYEENQGFHCTNGERRTACRCQFRLPSLNVSEISVDENLDLIINEDARLKVEASNVGHSFLMEADVNTLKLGYFEAITWTKRVEGIPLNGECIKKVERSVAYPIKALMDFDIEVRGASL